MPGVILMLPARELQGNVDEARRQYQSAGRAEVTLVARTLMNYIDFRHLRRVGRGEVVQAHEQLLKIVPDDLTALELRACRSSARDQKRVAEIEPLVEGRLQKVLERLDKSSTRWRQSL